jgi:hypothetical protein
MPARALWTGVLLILVSTLAVMASKFTPTALIPGILGLCIAVLGIIANRNPTLRKHLMHGALGLALLGVLGSLGGLPGFFALLSGGNAERPVAAVAQTSTVLICLGFLSRGIGSFIAARRKTQ